MSNIGLIIEERAADIGNFLVGRLLPIAQKRAVGPFVFIDHMGPKRLKAGEGLNVPPHPHIGLSTLTYLFEGVIHHKDSLGTSIEIEPGAVNWMTAGKGIVHSERTPAHLIEEEKVLHGMQIWVALPKELEEMEPGFWHISEDELPAWQADGLNYRLVAGEIPGQKSPVPVHSPLYLIEVKSTQPGTVKIGSQLFGESGLYILEGSIKEAGQEYGPQQMLIARDSTLCEFEMGENSTIYIFGGEPFPERRYLFWNFVSSSSEIIEKAKEDWKAQRMGKVPGETEFVPLPEVDKHVRFKK